MPLRNKIIAPPRNLGKNPSNGGDDFDPFKINRRKTNLNNSFDLTRDKDILSTYSHPKRKIIEKKDK